MIKINKNKKLSSVAPDYFSETATKIYKKVVKFLNEQGKTANYDVWLVEQYSTQFEIYLRAYEEINKHGIQVPIKKPVQDSAGKIIEHTYVGDKRNPAVQTYNEALKNLSSIGSQLGLSPKSRAELNELINNKDGDIKTIAKAMTNALK